MNEQEYLEYKRKNRLAKKNQPVVEDELVEFIPSPNFSSRRNHNIDMIVIHYTGANRIASTLDWFQRKESQVSSHYIIGRDGRTVQMVQDEQKAWHAGYSYWDGGYNLNKNSIGIELVGTDGIEFTNYQYESLISLCFNLINKHEIPLTRIVGHEHISGYKVETALNAKGYHCSYKVDPGEKFDWTFFIGQLELALDEEKRISEAEPVQSVNKKEIDIYQPQLNMNTGVTNFDKGLVSAILDFLSKILGVKL